MTYNRTRGFTLIELLVVIAIIGILSAVVLAALNTARSKGSDASIQSDLHAIQTQAAIYSDDNGHVYGTNVADESDCAAGDNMFADPTVARAVAGADTANGAGSVTCNVAAGGAAYAISAQLLNDTTRYWCVDSIGISTSTATALGTDTFCQ